MNSETSRNLSKVSVLISSQMELKINRWETMTEVWGQCELASRLSGSSEAGTKIFLKD